MDRIQPTTVMDVSCCTRKSDRETGKAPIETSDQGEEHPSDTGDLRAKGNTDPPTPRRTTRGTIEGAKVNKDAAAVEDVVRKGAGAEGDPTQGMPAQLTSAR